MPPERPLSCAFRPPSAFALLPSHALALRCDASLLTLFTPSFPPFLSLTSWCLVSSFLATLPIYSYKYVLCSSWRVGSLYKSCRPESDQGVLHRHHIAQVEARRDCHHDPYHRFVPSFLRVGFRWHSPCFSRPILYRECISFCLDLEETDLSADWFCYRLYSLLDPTCTLLPFSLPLSTCPSRVSSMSLLTRSLFRFQRRDRRVQEHLVHRLGCWRTGQDQAVVEAL